MAEYRACLLLGGISSAYARTLCALQRKRGERYDDGARVLVGTFFSPSFISSTLRASEQQRALLPSLSPQDFFPRLLLPFFSGFFSLGVRNIHISSSPTFELPPWGGGRRKGEGKNLLVVGVYFPFLLLSPPGV